MRASEPNAALSPGENRDGADLVRASLDRSSLQGVSLRGADLSHATLCGAVLTEVDLTGARLVGARLDGAQLDRVVLDGACLDEASARGAILSSCSLVGLEARGLKASGARFDKPVMDEARLAEVQLDAAVFEDAKLRRGALTSCTMVSCRILGGDLSDTVLRSCDLRGATLDDPDLRSATVEACRLGGARLRGARLRPTTIVDSDLQGTIIDRCRGLGPAGEQALAQAGAIVRLWEFTKVARVLRSDRRLQVALLSGSAALLLVGGVLWAVPQANPTFLLERRVRGLVEDRDPARCEALFELGGLLAERDNLPLDRHVPLLVQLSSCHSSGGDAGQAESSLRDAVTLAAADPRLALQTRLHLVRFLDAAGDRDAVDQELAALRAATAEPATLLEILVVEETLLGQRGEHGQARSPDGAPPAEPRWRELQLELAATLEQLPDPDLQRSATTAAELLVLGEWERARALLATVQPDAEGSALCRSVDGVVPRLVDQDRPELALELMAWLRGVAQPDPDDTMSLLRREVSLLLALDQPERASARIESLPPELPAHLAADRVLLLAQIQESLDSPVGTLALLDGLELPPAASVRQQQQRAWLRARALLALDREDEAVASLEPALLALPDEGAARALVVELAAWSASLERPGRLLELIATVDNPVIEQGAVGQQLAEAAMARQAGDGSPRLDDPMLLYLLREGDDEGRARILGVVLDQATAQGTRAETLRQLSTLIIDQTPAQGHAAMGRALVERAMAAGLYDTAEELLAQYQPEQSANPELRHWALGVRVALEQAAGHTAQAQASLEALLRDVDTVTPAQLELGYRLVDGWKQQEGWEEALALVTTLRQHAPTNPAPLSDQFTCLLALDRDEALERELQAASQLVGACQARVALVHAQRSLGEQPQAMDRLADACSDAGSTPRLRLEAAGILADEGLPERAMAVTRGLDAADFDAYNGAMFVRGRARWTAAGGDRAGAMALISEHFGRQQDRAALELLAEAWIDHHAAGGDSDGVIEAYGHCVALRPELRGPGLWGRSARALVALGAAGRIPALGGEQSWEEGIADVVADDALHRLIAADDQAGAWALLDQELHRDSTEPRRWALLDRARELGGRPGQTQALLDFLDRLQELAGPDTALEPRIAVPRARALASLERQDEALALLESFLAQRSPATIDPAVLDGYVRLLAQVHDRDHIERALEGLGGAGLPAQRGAALRFEAAQALLDRGDPGAALQLLRPLEGQAIERDSLDRAYGILARAQLASGPFEELLTLPERFPVAADDGPCRCWLALARFFPQGSPEALATSQRALEVCAIPSLGLEEVQRLARGMSGAGDGEALAVLETARDGGSLDAGEIAELDVMRAQLLAGAGDVGRAEAILEQVVDEAAKPDASVRASIALIRLIGDRQGEAAADLVHRRAQRALELAGPTGVAASEITMTASDLLEQHGDHGRSEAWLELHVAAHPEPGQARAGALQRLTVALLRRAASAGDHQAGRWRAHLDEALSITPANSPRRAELLAIELAATALQHGSDGDAVGTVLTRLGAQGMDLPGLVAAASGMLEAWGRGELARDLRARAERGG
jgi:uncharacterized protein YjbI with pentapeptide repeats